MALSSVKPYFIPVTLLAAAIAFQLIILPASFPTSHYDVLGISRNSSIEEVKQAYGKLYSKWSMVAQEDIQNLPIDITFSRLGEWLVDRKRIPADWRKKLAALRARISKAFASLPKDADPYFLTLDAEGKVV